MTKIVPNDLLNPTEKTIKNWNCSFIAVEGPNIADKLSLEDLEIPYESQYRARIVLKAGETDQPLIYGFIGKAVTFLMIKVTYDSVNDPYYRYEQEKYNITYYFEGDPVLRPLNRLMIMTGSADEKIPQIYLNNPLDYDVVLDVLHATVDSEFDLSGTTNSIALSDLNDVILSGLTSGDTIVYWNGIWSNRVSSNSNSMTIPQLKLDTGYYTETNVDTKVTDTLRCYWEAADTNFLNYNPEVWVFRRKNYNRKSKGSDWKMRHKKWTHEPHLNGIKFSGSSYYSGTIHCPVAEIATTGRHTEFTLSATGSSYKMILPLDPYDYIYGESGGTWIKLSDSIDYSGITKIKVTGRRDSLSLPLRFAIVIDNPDTNVNNPKIIGEMSDIIYMRYGRQPGNNNNKIRYFWNEIDIKMFDSTNRWSN
jgi:hypothetical protein